MRCTKYLLGLGCLALAGLIISGGCARYAPKAEPKHEHAHPEKGPHGGPLAELGDKEEFHAELILTKGKNEATVYILDGEAKKGVLAEVDEIVLELHSEKPPVQVKLKAAPEEGEKGGASRFVGAHEKISADLDPDTIHVDGVKVKGKAAPLNGKFGHVH